MSTGILTDQQTRTGDHVQLVGPKYKYYFLKLTPGQSLHTHEGILHHDDLIGNTWGSQIFSHTGARFLLLQPSFCDILLTTRRKTQILFPKDIGLILIKLGIGPESRVLEAGTGSGAFTTALAYAVGPNGHIVSYDSRPEMQTLARENLAKVALSDRVIFKIGDIAEGFEDRDTNFDAIFLDLPNPDQYLAQVRKALKNGGFFGSILPTTNQVGRLIEKLKQSHFDCLEVCETFIRNYKPIAARLRPVDRMVAHTGYLIFARKILPSEEGLNAEVYVANRDESDGETLGDSLIHE